MFASIPGQHVPAFESLRAFDLHLPVIIVTRAENRDVPGARLVMKDVLDGPDNLRLVGDVPCIVQFNDDWHSGFYSTDPKAAQSLAPWQSFTLIFRTDLVGLRDLPAIGNCSNPLPPGDSVAAGQGSLLRAISAQYRSDPHTTLVAKQVSGSG